VPAWLLLYLGEDNRLCIHKLSDPYDNLRRSCDFDHSVHPEPIHDSKSQIRSIRADPRGLHLIEDSVNGVPDIFEFSEAIADVIFSDDQAGKPVYALLTTEQARKIASTFGIGSPDAEAWLLSTLRAQFKADSPGNDPFTRYGVYASLHPRRSDPLETPMWLPPLVACAMAAEAMRATETAASNNYYSRLFELLEVPEAAHDRWAASYRDNAEKMWGGLNRWLESWEGTRGLPTAYAIGPYRYVGLAMSQALIRERDQALLPRFFGAEGLPPGYRIGTADMDSMLAPWMSRQPPLFSAAMRALWGNAMARDGIAMVACLELESWDGTGTEEVQINGGLIGKQARLLAQVRTFPSSSLTIDLLLPGLGDADLNITVETAGGFVALQTTLAPASSQRLADPTQVDPASLISDRLTLTSESAQKNFYRLPRRVVPLRLDELQNAYVESERVQLGEQTLLLVAEKISFKVKEILGAVARPGFAQLAAGSAGLPEGWTAFLDVQILDRFPESITSHHDFQALIPRAVSALTLSGGFVLPGLIRKWSSLAPPEIHVTSSGASHLLIQLRRDSVLGEVILEQNVDESVAIVPLGHLGLGDGEYLVTLNVDHQRKPSASSLLRLRSSDSPLFDSTTKTAKLAYRLMSGALWPLVADEFHEAGPQVTGAVVGVEVPEALAGKSDMAPARLRSKTMQAVTTRTPIRVGRGLGAGSCLTTGMHRYLIPTAGAGEPPTRSVEAECETCGQIKRFPTTAWGARLRTRNAVATKNLDFSAIPAFESTDPQDLSVAFDAFSHLGSGTPAQLAKIAGQVDGSALFSDVLLRRLEVLGHIDAKRDPHTLMLSAWEMTLPTLVSMEGDHWWLVGRQPRTLIAALEMLVSDAGGNTSHNIRDQGLPRFEIQCPRATIDLMISALEDDYQCLSVIENTALKLARVLPNLGSLSAGLFRVGAPLSEGLEKWDTSGATWIPARSLEARGAYRIRSYISRYFVRDEIDLEEGTIAFANAYLVKHLANLWARDPLVGYDMTTKSVVVPLGADLPGLYGRALVLASGRLPLEHKATRMLQYQNISSELAGEMSRRLTT
jgi:hypothetical protein